MQQTHEARKMLVWISCEGRSRISPERMMADTPSASQSAQRIGQDDHHPHLPLRDPIAT